MTALMWKSNLAVGIQVIDDQHGILLDALNEMRSALVQGEECEAVKVRLDRLEELIRLHVESEERLLEQHGFPALETYRSEHAHLLRQLEARPACCNSVHRYRQSDSVYELAEFLRSWFVSHTQKAELEYGPWLQERGVR